MKLQHRDYALVAANNLENVRADIWDVFPDGSHSIFPESVYSPDLDSVIKPRLNTLDLGSDVEPKLISKSVLGHTIFSPGGRDSGPTDVTFNFVDKEDLAIMAAIRDYQEKSGYLTNGFSLHKSQLTLDKLRVVFYNTLLQPTHAFVYFDGCYASCSLPRTVGGHGDDKSECSLTMSFGLCIPVLGDGANTTRDTKPTWLVNLQNS